MSQTTFLHTSGEDVDEEGTPIVLINRAQELFNKQKLQEKVDEQRRAGAKNARDAYPSITVAPGVGDLHKRSLEHAKRYTERVQQEQKK